MILSVMPHTSSLSMLPIMRAALHDARVALAPLCGSRQRCVTLARSGISSKKYQQRQNQNDGQKVIAGNATVTGYAEAKKSIMVMSSGQS
jgi:hypothetical protein